MLLIYARSKFKINERGVPGKGDTVEKIKHVKGGPKSTTFFQKF